MTITRIAPNNYRVSGTVGNTLNQTWGTVVGAAGADAITLDIRPVTAQGYLDFRAATSAEITLSAPGSWNLMAVAPLATREMTLKGTLSDNISLQINGSPYFVTDGSIDTIRTGGGVQRMTYTGALENSTLYMTNGGADLAVFNSTSTNWGFNKSATTVTFYDFTTGYTVTLGNGSNFGGVKTLTVTGTAFSNTAISGIDNGNYGTAITLTNLVADTDGHLNFMTNVKGAAGVYSGATTAFNVVTTTPGVQTLNVNVAEQVGTAYDGNLRVYAGTAGSLLYQNFNRVYVGTGGNDTTGASSTAAVLYGFAGNDILTGSTQADSIFGGANDDSITGSGGADNVYGEAGNDTLIFASATELNNSFTVIGGTGTDTIRMDTGTNTLTLADTDFTDVTQVETLALNGTGDQTVTLGTATNSAFATGMTITLQATASSLNLQGASSIRSITATGTDNADTLVGGAIPDLLTGRAGNDTLTGGLGIDTFNVDAGIDTVTDLGQGGADNMNISQGATVGATIHTAWTAGAGTQNQGANHYMNASISTAGFDVNLAGATATLGSDFGGYTISNTSNTMAASITGSNAADYINGGTSNLSDTLIGGAGNDTLWGRDGDDILTGGIGRDQFDISAGLDSITDLGQGGADRINVRQGAAVMATIHTAWACDVDTSNEGTNTYANVVITTSGLNVDVSNAFILNAGSSTGGYTITNTGTAATLTGSGAADSITGSTGDDSLVGGNGADTLLGGGGSDTLFGGLGADQLTGNDGNDIITGAGGADSVYGGNNDDSLEFFGGGAALALDATVDGGADTDTIKFTAAAIDIDDADFTRVIRVEKVQLADGTNIASFGTLAGAAGISTITGGSGADSITTANALISTVVGAAGLDTFIVSNTASTTISDLALNNDAEIVTNAANSSVNATLAGDWTATNATINNAATYNAFVVNSSAQNVDLSLATGNGYKIVSSGAASVTGSAGLDYIQAGSDGGDSANTTATGGAGDDRFFARSGLLTITDLGNGTDNFTINGFGQVDATVVANWTSGGAGWATYNENSVANAIIRVGSTYSINLGADNYANGFTIDSTGTGAITGSNTGGIGDRFINTSGSASFTGSGGLDTFNNSADTMTITDLAVNGDAEIVTNAAGAVVAATLAGNWTATNATSNAAANTAFTIAGDGTETVSLAAVNTGNGFTVNNSGTGSTTGSVYADILNNMSGSSSFTGLAGVDFFANAADTMTINDLAAGNLSDVVTNSATGIVTATLTGNWTGTHDTENLNTAANFTIAADGAETVSLAAIDSGNGFTVNNSGTGATTGSVYADILNNSGTATYTGGLAVDSFNVTAGAATITDLGQGGADNLNISQGASANATINTAWTAGAGTQNQGTNTYANAVITTSGLSVDVSGATVTVGAATGGYTITNIGIDTALVGSEAADSITGGTGGDAIVGRAGDDIIVVGGNTNQISGGSGDDTVRVGAFTPTSILSLGTGTNLVTLANGGSLAGATTTSTTGTWNLTIADNASVTLRTANLTGGAGVQLTNINAGAFESVAVNTTGTALTGYTLNSAVEFWDIGATTGAGNNAVSLGAFSQMAAFGDGNDTLDLAVGPGAYTGQFNMGLGVNTLNLATAGVYDLRLATLSNVNLLDADGASYTLVLDSDNVASLALAAATIDFTNGTAALAETLALTFGSYSFTGVTLNWDAANNNVLDLNAYGDGAREVLMQSADINNVDEIIGEAAAFNTTLIFTDSTDLGGITVSNIDAVSIADGSTLTIKGSDFTATNFTTVTGGGVGDLSTLIVDAVATDLRNTAISGFDTISIAIGANTVLMDTSSASTDASNWFGDAATVFAFTGGGNVNAVNWVMESGDFAGTNLESTSLTANETWFTGSMTQFAGTAAAGETITINGRDNQNIDSSAITSATNIESINLNTNTNDVIVTTSGTDSVRGITNVDLTNGNADRVVMNNVAVNNGGTSSVDVTGFNTANDQIKAMVGGADASSGNFYVDSNNPAVVVNLNTNEVGELVSWVATNLADTAQVLTNMSVYFQAAGASTGTTIVVYGWGADAGKAGIYEATAAGAGAFTSLELIGTVNAALGTLGDANFV